MVFLYQPFQPVAVHSSMVFLGNKVRNVLDVFFKAHPFFLRHQRDTGLVALPFRTPVVGVDGEFARCLDVNASYVTDSEIDSCLVSDIILGGGLSYKCGNFHYASSLVYHFHKFAFHLIVNRAVAVECPTALHMSRHGGYQIGVGNLFVEVAYKGFACRMAGGYLI